MIERTGDEWPSKLVLRLHLRGLDGVKVQTKSAELSASYALTRDPPQIVSLRRGDDEDVHLKPGDPNYPEIRLIGNDGRPKTKIPLEDGYFELPLPRAIVDDNSPSVTIHWIDFYRN